MIKMIMVNDIFFLIFSCMWSLPFRCNYCVWSLGVMKVQWRWWIILAWQIWVNRSQTDQTLNVIFFFLVKTLNVIDQVFWKWATLSSWFGQVSVPFCSLLHLLLCDESHSCQIKSKRAMKDDKTWALPRNPRKQRYESSRT